MNPADRRRLMGEVYSVLEAHSLSFDDFLQALADEVTAEAERQDHQQTKGCLLSAAEHLSHASMDYYVSLK